MSIEEHRKIISEYYRILENERRKNIIIGRVFIVASALLGILMLYLYW